MVIKNMKNNYNKVFYQLFTYEKKIDEKMPKCHFYPKPYRKKNI